MRLRLIPFCALLLLFTCLSPLFVSCKNDGDFLSWNKGRIVFIGEYEEDGCVFRARFSLDGSDKISVEMLSPDGVKGIVYRKNGDSILSECGGVTLPLSVTPAAISYALFALPESPLLESVVKEGAVKTETVRAQNGIYKIRYAATGLPEEILCLSESAPKSLYIVSFSSEDTLEKEIP